MGSELTGRTALVTGGGTGIGAAIAIRLAAAGAHVVVMGRRPEPLERVATGHELIAACVGDAARADDVTAAVALAVELGGGLDIVVANAGSGGGGAVGELDDAGWAGAWTANVSSAFVAARESLPRLIERRGVVVVISSLAGVGAGPASAGYTTAKHALIGLTRSLAVDYGPQGVRAMAICPGWVRTPMADREMDELGALHGVDRAGAYALATSQVPLRRPAEPEEIAEICAFLVSDAAAPMTGSVVMADGGASIVDVPTLAYGTHRSSL